MAIFLLFYKLLLEKESIHHFKRFFLLIALIASFIIPQVVFTEYVKIEPSTTVTQVLTLNEQPEIAPVVTAIEKSPVNWSLILWTIYGLGVISFGFRFLYNLVKIWKRIRSNTQIKNNSIVRVLLKEQLPPHTFLRYIFLNKQKFKSKSIPKSVLRHEETHATQRHSLDVLFLELLQVIFWFNPLIYVFKKAIKLNHEFLADSAVLNGEEDHLNYQNTLLSYLSNESFNTHQSVGIANAINYSSIKKRFVIMKKQTSKKEILIRSLLLLPLLAILLFGFSEKTTKNIEANRNSNNQIAPKRIIKLTGSVVDSKTLQPLENAEIRDEKGNLLTATDNQGNYLLKLEIEQPGEIYFSLSVKKNGYKPLIQQEHWGNIQGEIINSFYFGLQKKNSDVPEFSKLFTSNRDYSNSSNQEFKVDIDKEHAFDQKLKKAKKGNEKIVVEIDNLLYLVSSSGWIQLNTLNDYISVDDDKIIPASQLNAIVKRHSVKAMSPLEDYDNAQFAIYTSSGDINENLSKRAFNHYNILAKKYNAIPIEKRKIPLSDLRILESIYRNMTVEERKASQPFPECLPKQDQDGATKAQLAEYNNLANKYNTLIAEGGNIRIMKSDVDKLNYIFDLMSDQQKTSAEPFPDFPEPPPAPMAPGVKKGEKSNIPPPPAPKEPNTHIESSLNFAAPPHSPDAPKTLNTSNYASAQLKEIIQTQDPYDHNNLDLKALNGVPTSSTSFYTDADKKNTDFSANENMRVYIYNSSSLKTNKSPTLMNSLKDLANQDAQFYFDGKKITSEEGFKIVKSEKDIKIETLPYTNKQPEVRIYKKHNDLRIPAPPTPPNPVTPLDYVINAAKNGALFMYEDKDVSSDEAIELLKKNKELNIESRNKNGKTMIRITKEPVTIN
ncbi:hypothetical protein A9200_02275 [Maribacter hydrothermalis]|uniref:Peptidase M56 domain-containing protein n=2 Tax=Maribacter hydrothermalis TaxID=1836467 RepID=A0A1B7ZFC9_9FLAO|nr:hypothetical protein BTR34_10650 [Maribacter hydrothermalis]OBR42234.1 hypothetical protein A9200_02275 [Maribacter hydrothermalis]